MEVLTSAGRSPGGMESTVARGPVCTFCEEKLHSGQSFCAKCGHPTQWAAHDERVLWELGQWEGSRKAKGNGAAGNISERTQQLAENVRAKSAAVATRPPVTPGAGDSPYRRSIASRFRKVAPPDATPAEPMIQKPAQAPAAQAPAAQAPAASVRTPAPERIQSPKPPAATPRTAPPAASPTRTASQPAAPPRRAVRPEPQPVVTKPAGTRVSTATTRNVSTGVVRTNRASAAQALQTEAPPAPAPEAPAVRAVPAPAETPLVIMRKSVASPPAQNGNAAPSAPAASAAPVAAPPAKKTRQPKPPKPARAPKPKAERAPKPKKEKVKKESRKEHEKRERKHRRHSKRVNRRAASLDLKDGERVSLSIEGWSRFRRATLVVTNYRVALIIRLSPTVRWIPLEEVSTVTRRWHGAWSVVVAAPTEVLTLQKAKGQMLGSFQQLLESEVREARTAGNHRHHADITQEWCDRATTIWDSRFNRLRLWGRRHPIVTLILFLGCTAGAFTLTTVLTSAFSPVR